MATKKQPGLSAKELAMWEKIREARDVMQRSALAYYMLLQEIESKHAWFWNPGKAEGVSFDNWLETHHPLTPHASVFREFLEGSKIAGNRSVVEDIGTEATAELSRFKKLSKGSLDEYVQRCRNFRAVHDVSPSEETSSKWRRELDEGHEPRVNGSASKIAQLVIENKNLRAQLKQKESEIAALKLKLKGKKPGASASRS